MREYLLVDRPLNLEEMRNVNHLIAEVSDACRKLIEMYQHRKMSPSEYVAWEKLRTTLGFRM